MAKGERVAKKPKSGFKVWHGIVIAVAAFVITGAALFFGNVNLPEIPLWDGVDNPDVSLKPGEVAAPSVPAGAHPNSKRKEGVYTFLLCGTDGGGTRTDTMMVARLNVKEHTIGLVSIPRDTYIPNADRSYKKLNGAYAGKNLNRLLDEVASVVGFRPDFTAFVDFNGFVKLVDAIGGVDFEVPMDLKYNDPGQNLHIDIKKGLRHLNGEDALKVARFRHGYKTQDLQRVQVQRDLMKAVAKKVLSPSGISKLLPKLSEVVTENLQTELKWGEMTALAMEAAKVDMDTGAIFGTIPTKTVKGTTYEQVVAETALTLINSAINPYVADITAKDIPNAK
jgi:LCP family protein required for cell wall assembly